MNNNSQYAGNLQPDPNPIILDESKAEILFTKEQIKIAKSTDGMLSSEYILNKKTNKLIS